ncbi:MAG: hypothetical protein ACRDY0_01455, partial [Acidimicrobiales bacterium]
VPVTGRRFPPAHPEPAPPDDAGGASRRRTQSRRPPMTPGRRPPAGAWPLRRWSRRRGAGDARLTRYLRHV